jgi:hypothetical protein
MVGQEQQDSDFDLCSKLQYCYETGNNNSATIGDKHVSEVTQDGLNYGFGGYKNEAFVSLVKTKKAVIGSHGDKNMAKIVQKIDSI